MSKFKNEQGVYLTKGLFYETFPVNRDNLLYSLSTQDHPDGYPSIYRLYLETEDVTEFTFASLYFDGMVHWRKICSQDWFKPYLEAMRIDLHSKLKAKALEGIKEEAFSSDGKNRFAALKYLADKGYIEKETAKRVGRPNKTALIDPELKFEFDSAYQRVMEQKELN